MKQRIALSGTIARNGKPLFEVTLVTPTVGQMTGMNMTNIDCGDVDAVADLLPLITYPTLTLDEVDKLPLNDFNRLLEALRFAKWQPATQPSTVIT